MKNSLLTLILSFAFAGTCLAAKGGVHGELHGGGADKPQHFNPPNTTGPIASPISDPIISPAPSADPAPSANPPGGFTPPSTPNTVTIGTGDNVPSATSSAGNTGPTGADTTPSGNSYTPATTTGSDTASASSAPSGSNTGGGGGGWSGSDPDTSIFPDSIENNAAANTPPRDPVNKGYISTYINTYIHTYEPDNSTDH
ncbi:MAG: hypothetical protein KGK03_10435 [Candidatus Omnitrophica bacterium]|nr:hypothetical protein [Candidatus Omnitrophota bacterium]